MSLGIGVYRDVYSAVDTVDWTHAAPTVVKAGDQSGPFAGNRDCTNATVQLYTGAVTTTATSQCFVSTSMGLISTNGDVVQPAGYNNAYKIVGSLPGNPVTIAVPNQPAALSLVGYSSGPGGVLRLYKYLYPHLKFELSPAGPRFRLADGPDMAFKYDTGQIMQLNPSTLSFPQNGRYFIIDTIYNGFMRVDLLNLAIQPFAASLPRDSSGEPLDAQTAVADSGKFAAIAYNAPGGWGSPYFKIADIDSCSGGFYANAKLAPNFNCPTIDMLPQLKKLIPKLNAIYDVRFSNDRTITFVAQYGDMASSYKYARYSMTAGGQKASLVQYLALGDSYISGEGASNYRTGTDTERNRCHQSLWSYPYLLGANMDSFASVACSGAATFNVAKEGDKKPFQIYGGDPTQFEVDEALNSHTPGVALQNDFVKQDNPEAITISMGGNDIGFTDIITKCVDPTKNLAGNVKTGHTCYPTYEDRLELVNAIDRRLPQWRKLYADLKQDGAAGRRVYVIGYPQIAKVGGDCGLNVAMNADEVKLAHDLIAYLDSVIEQAAGEAGVRYVDTQDAFDGHRLCEGDQASAAMNGLTFSRTPWGDIGYSESFHPTKYGHQLLAATIAARTANLTSPMPAAVPIAAHKPVDPNLPLLQNAPVTGRTIYQVQPLQRGEPVVRKGSQLDLMVNAQSYYTKPQSVYEASLHSDPISLGRFTADANGDLDAKVTIPAAVEPGFHTLHLYGSDVFGNPIDLQQSFYVAGSPDDYDGDGLPNEADSCPLAAQSSVDKDADGIDDACDSQVIPASAPEPDGIVWRNDAVLTIEIQTTAGQ